MINTRARALERRGVGIHQSAAGVALVLVEVGDTGVAEQPIRPITSRTLLGPVPLLWATQSRLGR